MWLGSLGQLPAELVSSAFRGAKTNAAAAVELQVCRIHTETLNDSRRWTQTSTHPRMPDLDSKRESGSWGDAPLRPPPPGLVVLFQHGDSRSEEVSDKTSVATRFTRIFGYQWRFFEERKTSIY